MERTVGVADGVRTGGEIEKGWSMLERPVSWDMGVSEAGMKGTNLKKRRAGGGGQHVE